MTFGSSENALLGQLVTETSTTQKHQLGQIMRLHDPTYGPGEFIYLQGVASTAVNDWVTYNLDDWTTTLLAANAIGPVAVAHSANVASQYGWYQISGKVIGSCLTGFADNAQVWITATGGHVDDTSVAGDLVNNAKGASASVALSGVADFEISRPWVDNNSSAT